MNYLGDFSAGQLVYAPWSTQSGVGASITRATDGTVSVYKDNNGTQSVAGVTDDEDFDSITGIHMVIIDTGADAFYEAGHDYTIVLTGAVIDGETVNAILGTFSIENRTAQVQGDALLTAVDALPTNAELTTALADLPTNAELATALAGLNDISVSDILDAANAIETGVTPRGALRVILAAVAGLLAGATTTEITVQNPGGSKTRITMTVDADGNRSASVLDVT